MQKLIVDNYIIHASVLQVINLLQISLANGKLKDIQEKAEDVVVSCPLHAGGQESNGSCFVRKSDGIFHCFGCGEKGPFLKFVAACFDMSEDYAKSWLIKNFDAEIIESPVLMGDDISFGKKIATKKPLNESILDSYQSWTPYFTKRGLLPKTVQDFNLRYDAKYRQVIFPYYNEKDQLTTLLKRSIDTKTFFIENGITKPVYGINNIFKNNITACVLTEGLFDCLLANQYGMPAIATLGNPSEEQFNLINKSPLSVIYLMFDNDAAGKIFNLKAHKYLSKRIILIDVNIVGKKDIGELTKEEFWNFINKAKNS